MDVSALAAAIGLPTGSHVRWGAVSAVGAGALDVTVAGSGTIVTGVRYLASYSPAEGDTVAMIAGGGDLFVIGKLA